MDPIAIAFIFGLRTLEDIEAAFPSRLPDILTMNFTSQSLPAAQRPTAAAVLRLADPFATERRARYETFDLKFYPNRSATYTGPR